ncbi:MAG: hypothetical protein M3Y87_00490 [Myxococcota bacterium]|nr:hypothetical protein [Myxococcota bacterium]
MRKVVPVPDTGDWISAGFFFTARIPRPAWAPDPAVVPGLVLTLSPCLASVLPNGWPSPAVPPFVRPGPPFTFGEEVAREIERTVGAEAASSPDDWPWTLRTLADARAFGRRFSSPISSAVLIGVAVSPTDVEKLVDESSASERASMIRRGLPVEPGGTLRGYEVLGDGVHEAHSLLCTGSEVGASRELGVVFNADGLLDDFATARRVAEWASRDHHGEPVDYFPYRMAEYEWR